VGGGGRAVEITFRTIQKVTLIDQKKIDQQGIRERCLDLHRNEKMQRRDRVPKGRELWTGAGDYSPTGKGPKQSCKPGLRQSDRWEGIKGKKTKLGGGQKNCRRL